MLKIKKQVKKIVKITGKQKTKKPVKLVKLDKIQELIKKACMITEADKSYFHIEPTSVGYLAVEFFSKHKPVLNKVYTAKQVYKGHEADIIHKGTELFIRRYVRKTLSRVFKMKCIISEPLKNNPKYAVSIMFIKS